MTTPLKRKAAGIASSTAKKPKANASITSFFSSPSASSKPAAAAAATASTAPTSSAPTDSSTVPSSPTTAVAEEAFQKSAPSTTVTATSISTATTSAKPEAATPAPAAPKFDKAKWVEKLTPEQKDLLALEIETLDESWLAVLKDDIVSKDFLQLKRFLKAEHLAGKKIFPPATDVYSWSRHTPLHSVKAVILGQDPYHGPNQAHGLCFSVRPPTPAPPSLLNIYKLLKKEYPSFSPPPNRGGLLTPWADRGVLLLNTCLTVRAHEANSHAGKGWEAFTQKVVDVVAKRRTKGVVFLAWGKPAEGRVRRVDRGRHCVLQSVHPSPLSAARGFFDCGHFRKTNEWLKGRYGEGGEIDWNLDVPPEKTGL
ncbi:uracil DNA glycosylase [Puttea exsequens]|nr:uracil DNA glycosylase [Puttea exsequens]